MLNVKRLDFRATLPTVAHPGEDLAYDLYALEDAVLWTSKATKVRTGIAAQASTPVGAPLGLLIRDRSSMACKDIMVSAGVVDHGYTGEIQVVMTHTATDMDFYAIKAGDKIAQMIPIRVHTGDVVEVESLDTSSRGADGWGSTGR